MSDIDILNEKLAGEYVTLDGHKIFRLVWSESIFENRHGTFREFTESGLFIREVTETRKVRKYNYIHNRWIFEMWAPGGVAASPELPDSQNGDYVPVYVFEGRDGNYLPPNEKVVRFLIASLEGKVRRDDLPSREYLEEREVGRMVESMDDHPSWFQTRPGDARNAVAYRRATFNERSYIDQEMFRAVEREERLAVRERVKVEELTNRKKIEEFREVVRAREAENARKRAEKERVELERERERERREELQKREKDHAEKVKVDESVRASVRERQLSKIKEQHPEVKSPMHGGKG